MKHTYDIRCSNALLLFSTLIFILAYSCASGQHARISHRGAQFAYGLQEFRRDFGDHRTSRAVPSSRGVTVGYIMGNGLLRTQGGCGIFTSAQPAQAEFMSVKTSLTANFYPIDFFRTKEHLLDFYLQSGLHYDWARFTNEHRLNHAQLSQSFGVGVEWLIPRSVGTIYIFQELLVATPLLTLPSEFPPSTPAASINFGLRYLVVSKAPRR